MITMVKQCPVCGREFVINYSNQRYCSPGCYEVAHRKKKKYPCSRYSKPHSIPIEMCLNCSMEVCRYE